jgi:dTMP kinase
MAPGLFLSLDGPDGAGKSTQLHLLAAWLRGRGQRVTECTDPGGTDLGRRLREILLGYQGPMAVRCEALLFMASRAQLVEEIIRPALAVGNIVLSDRFLLANVVYQGHAGGLDPAELWQLGRFSTSGLEPDLTLLLDVPLAQSLSRRKEQADRLESRGTEFHDKVRAGFLTEAQRDPGRIRVIDGAASLEEVQEALREEVKRSLPILFSAAS